MNARHYQALLAGALVATILLFLFAQHVRAHNRSGLAMFHGNLPPIPEYEPEDNPEVSDPLSEEPDTQAETQPTSGSAEIDLSELPSQPWDDAWDDKELWPSISKATPAPASG